MGREVRMVPKNWEHPTDKNGQYHPMFEESYENVFNRWLEERNQWMKGFQKDWSTHGYKPKKEECKDMSFEEWHGEAPDSRYYMPQWDDKEKTHYMMYETTSEGTPKSPAFETPEELAKWLVENNASTFASMTTDYETWLKMIKGI